MEILPFLAANGAYSANSNIRDGSANCSVGKPKATTHSKIKEPPKVAVFQLVRARTTATEEPCAHREGHDLYDDETTVPKGAETARME